MNVCLLCDKPDETGSYLCPGCTKATVVRLECLPALYDGLAPHLAPAGGIGTGRSGKGGPAPLPVNERVLDLRAPGGMVGIVEDWESAVRVDRRMRQTTPAGSVEARLKSAVTGLLANMPWIAVSWPQAGAFAEEIRDLARSVSSIVSPPDDRQRVRHGGHCPAKFDGVVCGAALFLVQGEQVITCRWCGTEYPPSSWAALRALIAEDAARNAA
ncbi:hypothetical protein [Streptomyces sp. CFMR 7]|uniref:hypothetical protein n=1 Tax=Streptomyces sp. CFMR 7 TaxID=1649184 RepID=UPI00119CD2AC|nr:hypothetical protein [Streptomyces sp. CFMR 7]